MYVSESDERFYIGPSTIADAGYGLFAKVPLARGDRLEVIGALIDANSIADTCTRYADIYKFRVGDKLLIPLGYGSMANHSDTPNSEKIIENGKLYLQALRVIARDEEILFTYSEYARNQFKKPAA